MLNFFRKYQRFFFLIVTVVIVISFSFFGAMNVLMETPTPDPIAFEAVDGAKIKRSELEKMVAFLSSDAEEKKMYGGVWGPNFLNDGVFAKNFLQNGLAQILAEEYPELIGADLEKRHAKEKRFTLYHHPKAEFISVENAWGFVAPGMKQSYRTLQIGENALDPELFDARVQLYLGQRTISPQTLKQILHYQKRQYSWLPDDPNLFRADLSLYGYHSAEDWFGPKFMRLACSVIMNMATVAKEQGYVVTDEEAYADLLRNAAFSYEQNKESPYVDVSNPAEYMNEQLRRMRLDRGSAVAIWKQVLLFRRLFETYGDSLLVAKETLAPFVSYAGGKVSGDLYSLPEEYRFSSFTDLQRFQMYLESVAEGDVNSAKLPVRFRSAAEVAKKTPELVERTYRVAVATYDLGKAEQRIPLSAMWAWQTSNAGWSTLQGEFSLLAVKKGESEEERFEALESLDPASREQVDQKSRRLMVASDTSLIQQGLDEAEVEEREVGVRLAGDSSFKGIADSKALTTLFDASLKEGSEGESAQEKLLRYSQDGRHFFAIRVVEREPKLRVLSYADAKRERILMKMLNKELESAYASLKAKQPSKYETDVGEFKPLADVRMEVARARFQKVLRNLDRAYGSGEPMTVEEAAHVRMKSAMESARSSAMNGASLESSGELAAQWVPNKEELTFGRGEEKSRLHGEEAFALEPNSWTEVTTPANGDQHFFYLRGKEEAAAESALLPVVRTLQKTVGYEVQRSLLKVQLSSMRERKEIELDALESR